MTAFLIVVLAWFVFAAILVLLSMGIEASKPNTKGTSILASAILLVVYVSMATWDIFLLVS